MPHSFYIHVPMINSIMDWDKFINFSYFKYRENTHLSDYINENEIDSWSSNKPVFISAQTGMGKNFFIQHVLLRKLHNENVKYESYQEEGKILLLSNRIALNRQGKLQLANLLVDITGDDSYKRQIEKYYTSEGIDKLIIDLGIITVCSYQRLYEDENVQKQNFKYVICDECHFFTSDASFNPFTDEILKIIVKKFHNSTRIYMSATLEDTFNAIISREFTHYHKLKEYSNYDFYCHYYYFQRNFDHINKIYAYDNLNQIISKIKENSFDKWLIFVASKKNGKSLKKLLSKEKITCSFLSAKSKNPDKKKEYEIYQSIVENENFPSQVLISTSVLDNGINIKDSSVKNIVIDLFDRTEFIQMLGRIRISNNEKVNLYIKNFSCRDIEKLLIDDIIAIILRLKLDLADVKERESPEYYRQLSLELKTRYDATQIFYSRRDQDKIRYNKCAIEHLINKITTMFRVIRIIQPDFSIEPEKLGTFRGNRSKIYSNILYAKYHNSKNLKNKYVNIINDKIIQILASKEEKNNEDYQKLQNIIRNNWQSSALDDTFLDYLFKYKIPIELNKLSKNITDNELLTNITYMKTLTHEQIDELHLLTDSINHYKSILDISNKTYPAIDQQLRWIERNDIDDVHFLDEQKNIAKSDLDKIEISTLIDDMAISKEEYKNSTKQNKKYTSFKDDSTLLSKASPVKPHNKKLTKILEWFSNEDKIIYTPNDLSKVLEDKPFTSNNFAYKLKKVRGNTEVKQHYFWIFVKYPNTQT